MVSFLPFWWIWSWASRGRKAIRHENIYVAAWFSTLWLCPVPCEPKYALQNARPISPGNFTPRLLPKGISSSTLFYAFPWAQIYSLFLPPPTFHPGFTRLMCESQNKCNYQQNVCTAYWWCLLNCSVSKDTIFPLWSGNWLMCICKTYAALYVLSIWKSGLLCPK